MQSSAKSVEDYLKSLPEDRRSSVAKVREVILKHLPKGYEEVMVYGMIGYIIPLSRYPITYNNQPLGIAALASQKNYMSLYLMGVYDDKDVGDWFKREYQKSGKKLNMGKSCLRFKQVADIPLALIRELIAKVSVEDYIVMYEKSRHMTKKK